MDNRKEWKEIEIAYDWRVSEHTDSGRVEGFINTARHMLNFVPGKDQYETDHRAYSDTEIVTHLVLECGAKGDEAELALVAAKML